MADKLDTSTLGPVCVPVVPNANPRLILGELIDRWLEERYELLDAMEFPDMLVKAGYAVPVKYDPEKHGPSDDAEAGDPWYELTPAGKDAHKGWLGRPA